MTTKFTHRLAQMSDIDDITKLMEMATYELQKDFLTEEFLLQTETSQELYHDHAEDMPIFDYHCHLSPKQIAEDVQFENITQAWLYGDHYKWRAMRSNCCEVSCRS